MKKQVIASLLLISATTILSNPEQINQKEKNTLNLAAIGWLSSTALFFYGFNDNHNQTLMDIGSYGCAISNLLSGIVVGSQAIKCKDDQLSIVYSGASIFLSFIGSLQLILPHYVHANSCGTTDEFIDQLHRVRKSWLMPSTLLGCIYYINCLARNF